MNYLDRIRAKQRGSTGSAEADREAKRQIALAVSIALRKADEQATELVESLKAENDELQSIIKDTAAVRRTK